jgi:hypothetical protein
LVLNTDEGERIGPGVAGRFELHAVGELGENRMGQLERLGLLGPIVGSHTRERRSEGIGTQENAWLEGFEFEFANGFRSRRAGYRADRAGQAG